MRGDAWLVSPPLQHRDHGVQLTANHSFQPCTSRDFMNYLLYIEVAAENLQFYLWFRDYIKRFSQLPANEKVLSVPWYPERNDPATLAQRGPRLKSPPATAVPNIFKGTAFDSQPVTLQEKGINPFEDDKSSHRGDYEETATLQSSVQHDIKKSVAMAFEGADVKVQPCMKFPLAPRRMAAD